MITRTRKLLTLATQVGLAATLAACGTAHSATRAVEVPAPVMASAAELVAPTPQVTPRLVLLADPMAAMPAAASSEPVATPMCDPMTGRPLAGNVRGKMDPVACTAAELAALGATQL